MSDAPSARTTAAIDLSDVRAAIGRIQRAEEEVTRARGSVTEARRSLTAALIEACRPLREGRAELPDGLVHELYWEWEEVRVNDIARALKLAASAVASVAGPTTVVGRCDRCGGPAEGEKRTRGAYVHLACPACTEAQERAEDEERKQLEVRAAVRDLVAEWERKGELPFRYDGRW